MKEHKAIALFSGGLDSILAVKWMQSRGYTVIPVFFTAPYLPPQRAILSAKQNDLDLQIKDVSAEHVTLLYNPVYGFGKHMNPCIDCHGFMFRQASLLMDELGADYIISGEVLGQRPMSQRRDALDSVAKLSGIRDLIVRPLCQQHLPDTLPLREAWVDKDDMLDFHGRGREAQMKLAKELGVKDFPPPAGGCLLTDRNYCLRLKDLMERQEMDYSNLMLLNNGRHFRFPDGAKLIIGRDEPDNDALESSFKNGYRLLAKDIMGPLGLLIADEVDEQTKQEAVNIFLYYHPKAENTWLIEVDRYIDGHKVGETVLQKASKSSADNAKQYRLSYD